MIPFLDMSVDALEQSFTGPLPQEGDAVEIVCIAANLNRRALFQLRVKQQNDADQRGYWPKKENIDFSLKQGDKVYNRNWGNGMAQVEVVDANWALRAIAVRLAPDGAIVIWPADALRRDPWTKEERDATPT